MRRRWRRNDHASTSTHGLFPHGEHRRSSSRCRNDGFTRRQQRCRQWQRELHPHLQLRHSRLHHGARHRRNSRLQRMVRMHLRKNRDMQRNCECQCDRHRHLCVAHYPHYAQLRGHRLAGPVQRGPSHRRHRRSDMGRRSALRQHVQPRHHQRLRSLQHALSSACFHHCHCNQHLRYDRRRFRDCRTHAASRFHGTGTHPRCRDSDPHHQSIHLRHECLSARAIRAERGQPFHQSLGRRCNLALQLPAGCHQFRKRLVLRKPHRSHRPQDTSEFNQQVQSDLATGTKTIGTVPVNGWVAKDGTSCSFPKTTYPSQVGFDPYGGTCGDGLYPWREQLHQRYRLQHHRCSIHGHQHRR